MNELDIYNSIISMVPDYSGKDRGKMQRRYLCYPYPQRLNVLTDLLKYHVLRERGDIGFYLDMQKNIDQIIGDNRRRKKDKKLFDAVSWLSGELAKLAPVTYEGNTLVISLSVWGDDYTSRFVELCLPSMMAKENLPFLVGQRKVVLHVMATQDAVERITGSDVYVKITNLGVKFDFVQLPPELVGYAGIDHEFLYWFLGMTGTLGLHYAKALRADFHHSYPDCIYSGRFFAELMRISGKGLPVLASGIRTDDALFRPNLAQYVSDGVIDMPAADFVAHQINAMHLMYWSTMVNNRPKSLTYPDQHVMVWESEDSIALNSPHMSILWMPESMVLAAKERFYMTLDSELDLLLGDSDFLVPGLDDDMYFAELTTPDRGDINDMYADAFGAAHTIYDRIKHRDLVRFFLKTMLCKINRKIRPVPENVIPYANAKTERAFLFNALISGDPYDKGGMKRSHKGRIFHGAPEKRNQ